MSEDRQSPHELVVVRRRGGGHDDGHHGGAWKIAFADFMTALMCFFLVMWLINSTDNKTLTQVATYFNPLRLNDRQPSQKGLNDPGPQDARSESGQAKKAEKDQHNTKTSKTPPKDKKETNSAESAAEERGSGSRAEAGSEELERELLRDPYGVIERIAAGETGSSGYKVGTEPREVQGLPSDSFDGRLQTKLPPDELQPKKASGPNQKGPAASAGEPLKSTADETSIASANGEATESGLAKRKAGETADPKEKGAAKEAVAAKEKAAESEEGGKGTSANDLRHRLSDVLADIKPGAKPTLEVVDLKKEILISLTDEFNFGMFAVGSARPTRELVTVMDRVAKVLAATGGPISIRGHTDGRQYRTADNDNWRLSMARAQMAFYMLVRGGLQENRVKQLGGFADRVLKSPAEPLASVNRRIEILVAKER